MPEGLEPSAPSFLLELPHLRLRDKTSVLVYVIHIICDFLVTFTLPYLLNALYANLGGKVAFIYGPVALVGVVWLYCESEFLQNFKRPDTDEMQS